MLPIRSDAWDGGNRLTQFREHWTKCLRCEQPIWTEYAEDDLVCDFCRNMECRFCGSGTFKVLPLTKLLRCHACGVVLREDFTLFEYEDAEDNERCCSMCGEQDYEYSPHVVNEVLYLRYCRLIKTLPTEELHKLPSIGRG